MSFIKIDQWNHVIALTLNRPKVLNAINLEMILECQRVYRQLHVDKHQHSILILRGSPRVDTQEPLFSAGGDVVAFSASTKEAMVATFEAEFLNLYLASLLPSFGKLQISIIDGITFGGGLGISTVDTSPVRIVTERSALAMPEAQIGFFCDVGASYFLHRVNTAMPGFGTFMGLTGHRVQGADAVHLSLATHYLPSSLVDSLYQKLQHALHPPHARQIIEAMVALTPLPPLSYPPDLLELISSIFNQPTLQDIFKKLHAYLNIPSFPHLSFLQQTVQSMSRASLTSLKLIHHLITSAHSLTYPQILSRDFQVVQAFAWIPSCGADFTEGVRALLIDKDKNPRWSCLQLESIDLSLFFNHSFPPLNFNQFNQLSKL